MWVNIQSQTDGGGFRVLGSNMFSSGGIGHGWFLYFLPEATHVQRLGFEVDQVAPTATATINAFNTWLFIAATWDQSSTGSELKFYAGSPTSSVAQVGSTLALTTSMTDLASALLRVGGYSSNPGTSPDALVDDFRVYGSEIKDATALNAIMNENLPEPSSLGLLAIGALVLGRTSQRR
jgi:hypothetical protein